ncbi:MAG TPA: YqaJ viral recombinase family protein [Burkholderiaceae bacterium]
MKTVKLIQGSIAWNEHRAQHDNASDAPAMMNVSPYKTRNQLLQERHTGISAEIDAATQRRFDDGHRFEGLARRLAEDFIGQALYPVTGVKGRFSASFDGLTLDESINYEHKTINDEIRAAQSAGDLGLHYRVQMEHQMYVCEATRTLFMASRWDQNGNLIEEKHFWYESDPALRQRVIDGWAQFEKDLAAYQPPAVEHKAIAEAILQLPALALHIRGEVVASNLADYRTAAEAYIASIKTDLETDDDFANAEAQVKFFAEAEKDLEAAKKSALGQTASIDELLRTVELIQEKMRGKRLVLQNSVTTKKAAIKEGVLADGRKKYAAHIQSLEAEIDPLRLTCAQPDFAGAAKNKRTLASLRNAVDTELANGKITADAAAGAARAKLTWYKENAAGFEFLFRDLEAIATKPAEDFQLIVTTRIAEHKTAEAKREAAAAVAKAAASAPATGLDMATPPPASRSIAVAALSISTTDHARVEVAEPDRAGDLEIIDMVMSALAYSSRLEAIDRIAAIDLDAARASAEIAA